MQKCDRDYRNSALYFAVYAEHHERLALQYEQQARQLTTIPALHTVKPQEA